MIREIENGKTRINISSISKTDSVLIIKHETGIVYEATTGGKISRQSRCEGFAINVGLIGQDFDDCHFGCDGIPSNFEKQELLAHNLDDYLKKISKTQVFCLDFDFSRIREITEGWWPVIFRNESAWHRIIESSARKWEGYLCAGNCTG